MSLSNLLFEKDVKRIGFFGLGSSNLALLESIIGSEISIVLRSDKEIDRALIPGGLKITAIYEKESALDALDEDVLVLSPSVRRERQELTSAAARGTRLTSDAELFFEGVDSPVYAISGSDGKSTTSVLTQLLLGNGAALCGNFGRPMTPLLRHGYSAYVVELSSFMLRYFSPISERAALTNVTPNHLDWHADFEEYKEAKLGIFKRCREAVLSLDDKEITDNMHSPVFAAVSTERDFDAARSIIRAEVYYTLEGGTVKRNGESVIAAGEIKRRERHNIKNFMLALALTDGKRCQDPRKVAAGFGGLPHRCELVGEWRGIKFVNSSIDTTPNRCVSTLSSLNTAAVVILGGRGKGVPFTPIKEPLSKIGRAAVIFGECGEEIISSIPDGLPYRKVANMEEAVRVGAELAHYGDTVILSPAATSYDAYKCFEERGEDFKSEVKKYCEKHR